MTHLLRSLRRRYEEKKQLFALSIDVTGRCNLKCRHCYHDENDRPVDLPLEIFRRLVDDASSLGALTLLLTGGEPFLRRDWKDLIESIGGKFLLTRIFSHGGFIDEERARFLRDQRIGDVGVSLYAMDNAVHDDITRHVGSCARTRCGIESLVRNGVHVTVKTTLLKGRNEQEVRSIADWVRELGPRARHEINTLIVPSLKGSQVPTQYRVTLSDGATAIASCSGDETTVDSAPTFGIVQRLKRAVCGAGTLAVHVGAEGLVKPCMLSTQVLGDLADESLVDIWNRQSQVADEDRSVSLDRFTQCTACQYIGSCQPCLALARRREDGQYEAPTSSCYHTYSRILAHSRDTELVPPPPTPISDSV